MYTVIGIVKWTSCKLNNNHSCIKLFQTKIILNSLLVKSVSASVKRVSAWTWPNSAARMAGLRPFKSTMFGLAPRSRRNEIIFSLFLHAAKWRPVSPFSGSRLTSKYKFWLKLGLCFQECLSYPASKHSVGDCESLAQEPSWQGFCGWSTNQFLTQPGSILLERHIKFPEGNCETHIGSS